MVALHGTFLFVSRRSLPLHSKTFLHSHLRVSIDIFVHFLIMHFYFLHFGFSQQKVLLAFRLKPVSSVWCFRVRESVGKSDKITNNHRTKQIRTISWMSFILHVESIVSLLKFHRTIRETRMKSELHRNSRSFSLHYSSIFNIINLMWIFFFSLFLFNGSTTRI